MRYYRAFKMTATPRSTTSNPPQPLFLGQPQIKSHLTELSTLSNLYLVKSLIPGYVNGTEWPRQPRSLHTISHLPRPLTNSHRTALTSTRRKTCLHPAPLKTPACLPPAVNRSTRSRSRGSCGMCHVCFQTQRRHICRCLLIEILGAPGREAC